MTYLYSAILNSPADNFPASYTTLIVGLSSSFIAALAIIFNYLSNNKGLKLQRAREKWERQKAYNKVLGRFLKVFYSYIQHKRLYDENGVKNFPDHVLPKIAERIDSFYSEIDSFRECINTESEIIPEIAIMLHELLDILRRFQLLKDMIPSFDSSPDPEKAKLIFIRAHSFAVKELLDEYFNTLFFELAKKADVSKEFLESFPTINSEEGAKFSSDLQDKLLTRLMESLSRQTGEKIDIESIKGPSK